MMEIVPGYKAYGERIREGDVISGIVAVHDETGAFIRSRLTSLRHKLVYGDANSIDMAAR